MKKGLSKKDAEKKISDFFEKNNFEPKDVKKIIRLAMNQRIRLGKRRGLFCKKCFFKLDGKIRIKNGRKSVLCNSCNFVNRINLNRRQQRN